MIVKDLKTKVTVDIEIHGPAEVQTAGHAAIDVIKIISRRKGITSLGDEFHRRLGERAHSKQQQHRQDQD